MRVDLPPILAFPRKGGKEPKYCAWLAASGQSFCDFHPANSGHTRFTTAPLKSHATH